MGSEAVVQECRGREGGRREIERNRERERERNRERERERECVSIESHLGLDSWPKKAHTMTLKIIFFKNNQDCPHEKGRLDSRKSRRFLLA